MTFDVLFACLCTLIRGLTPTDAEEVFLKTVSKLDTYGVDPHPVKVCLVLLLYVVDQHQ
jgi:hypothetical protein